MWVQTFHPEHPLFEALKRHDDPAFAEQQLAERLDPKAPRPDPGEGDAVDAGDEGGANSEGVNANLWAGLVLLVVGGSFIAWSRLRPTVVPEAVTSDDMESPKN